MADQVHDVRFAVQRVEERLCVEVVTEHFAQGVADLSNQAEVGVRVHSTHSRVGTPRSIHTYLRAARVRHVHSALPGA